MFVQWQMNIRTENNKNNGSVFMTCDICGSYHVVHIENAILNGKPYRIYKCKDCGFIMRVAV